jgi:hypothetical protein
MKTSSFIEGANSATPNQQAQSIARSAMRAGSWILGLSGLGESADHLMGFNKSFFPHLCVGFLFLILYPAPPPPPPPPPLCHTQLLCHRLSFTHNLLTHRHTQLCRTKLAHTQLCHTPSFNTNFTQIAHTYTAQGRCAHVNRMISHKRFLVEHACVYAVFKQATAPSGSTEILG